MNGGFDSHWNEDMGSQEGGMPGVGLEGERGRHARGKNRNLHT